VQGIATPDQPERACLMLADISGYTTYVAGVELDHAQDILADLTDTVVLRRGPRDVGADDRGRCRRALGASGTGT
jgi:hypothetical protein